MSRLTEYLIAKLRNLALMVKGVVSEPESMILDDMEQQESAQEQAGSSERRPIVLVADSSQ